MPLDAHEQALAAVVGDQEMLADLLCRVSDNADMKHLGDLLRNAFSANRETRPVWLLRLGEMLGNALYEALLDTDEYRAELRRVSGDSEP